MTNKEEKPAMRIERLNLEIERERKRIESCMHQFSEPVQATRNYFEPIYKGLEPHGSDPIPLYDYVERTENGWKRECERCGYSQYTAKTKQIVQGYEPDFGGTK